MITCTYHWLTWEIFELLACKVILEFIISIPRFKGPVDDIFSHRETNVIEKLIMLFWLFTNDTIKYFYRNAQENFEFYGAGKKPVGLCPCEVRSDENDDMQWESTKYVKFFRVNDVEMTKWSIPSWAYCLVFRKKSSIFDNSLNIEFTMSAK